MFCKSCGSNVEDGADFCPVCGAKMSADVSPAMAVMDEEAKASGKKCMIWGIVAAVLAEFGLLGLIFAIIAKGKVKKHIRAGYPLTGMAKAGRILSKVALILSIVMTVFWFIYIIIIIVAVLAVGEAGGVFAEDIFNAALKSF